VRYKRLFYVTNTRHDDPKNKDTTKNKLGEIDIVKCITESHINNNIMVFKNSFDILTISRLVKSCFLSKLLRKKSKQ
jgi:hypothetical protein